MERAERFQLATLLGLFCLLIILLSWSFIYDAQTKFLTGTQSSYTEQKAEPKPTLPPIRPQDPVTGSNDPKAVSIHVFSDFNCGYCRLSENEMIRAILELKQPVRVTWRDLPISTTAREPMLTALAGRCAHAQGKFWEFHDFILGSKKLDERGLREQAGRLGLNQPAFDTCMDQGTYLNDIKQDVSLARQHLILTSPTFFVGNQPAATGYISSNEFKKLILQAQKSP